MACDPARDGQAGPIGLRPDRAFYSCGAALLARRLLGQRLVRILPDRTRLSGLIVETEAYLGVRDRASHAFGGRRTARNESMYARPGTAYVYFTYGMHFCMNVVCATAGVPEAVLLRALEPVEGTARMAAHRADERAGGRALLPPDLCSGPGKLCQALAIDRGLDGVDLVDGARLWIEQARSRPLPGPALRNTPRIGIGSAGSWADKPLRWYVAASDCVSGARNPRGGRTTRGRGRGSVLLRRRSQS